MCAACAASTLQNFGSVAPYSTRNMRQSLVSNRHNIVKWRLIWVVLKSSSFLHHSNLILPTIVNSAENHFLPSLSYIVLCGQFIYMWEQFSSGITKAHIVFLFQKPIRNSRPLRHIWFRLLIYTCLSSAYPLLYI